MNFISFIFLSGLFCLGISNLKPNMEDTVEYHKEVESMANDFNVPREERNTDTDPPVQEEQMDTNSAAGTDKHSHHYKDVKEYKFTTQESSGQHPEITVKATTELTFGMKNYQINTTSESSTKEENEPSEYPHKNKQKQTPNVPDFWTVLNKAINGTTVGTDDKDQLFQPIPNSDVNATSEEEKLSDLENIKLRLILGITLMILIIFVTLLVFCIATLFKLKNLGNMSQHSVYPALAAHPYLNPYGHVSDTSSIY